MKKHSLPELEYSYRSLEPYIDEATMRIHHTKHHQTYIDKLNGVLEKHPKLFEKDVNELLKNINSVPEDIRLMVRNHGGGHSNHSFFWKILSPKKQEIPSELMSEIKKNFSSFDKFKEEFNNAALSRFGSGWAWLVMSKGKLEVVSTANQDSPLMDGKIPILGLDIWEHAYYLNYQNKRNDYIEAFWNIVNWEQVNENLLATK